MTSDTMDREMSSMYAFVAIPPRYHALALAKGIRALTCSSSATSPIAAANIWCSNSFRSPKPRSLGLPVGNLDWLICAQRFERSLRNDLGAQPIHQRGIINLPPLTGGDESVPGQGKAGREP